MRLFFLNAFLMFGLVLSGIALAPSSAHAQSAFSEDELAQARRFIEQQLSPELRQVLQEQARQNGRSVEEELLSNKEKFDVGSLVTYGPDNRVDAFEVKDKDILDLLSSAVALVETSALTEKAKDKYELSGAVFSSAQNLCATPAQKFSHQLSAAFCSGVLVGDDLVATAGHCVSDIWNKGGCPLPEPTDISDVRFVFGFKAKTASDAGVTAFSSEHIYKAVKVESGKCTASATDWALVRLDRKVPEGIAKPAKKIGKSIALDDGVFVIGHPVGLPVKYAPDAVVRDASKDQFFIANLDTFGGNSGSGVFSQKTKELVGILVRGETDFLCCSGNKCTKNTTGYCPPPKCNRVHQCPTTGCRGEEVTKIREVQFPVD